MISKLIDALRSRGLGVALRFLGLGVTEIEDLLFLGLGVVTAMEALRSLALRFRGLGVVTAREALRSEALLLRGLRVTEIEDLLFLGLGVKLLKEHMEALLSLALRGLGVFTA